MNRNIVATTFLVSLLTSAWVAAQDLANLPAPQKEHEWLKQFVGEWESDGEGSMGPGQDSMKCKGTMSSRMLGDLWMISNTNMEMTGTKVSAIMTLGYNTEKKKYVGTWVDSMLNHLWVYEGGVDETGKILALDAEGPSFVAEGKTAKYRDSYEFKSKDHIVLTSSMLDENGEWFTFMNVNIRRKK